MSTTTTTTTATAKTYGARDFDPAVLIAQIGRMNILGISGGRVLVDRAGIILPVRYGYAVEVYLADDDTYTVRRTFTRAGRRTVKGERVGVYADEVGDVAWAASCYHDPF